VNLKGRRALLIGFGRSGRASASFVRKQQGEVRVVDRGDTPELRSALEKEGIPGRLGGYSNQDLEGIDLVVVSPGVPWDLPLVEAAREKGIAVTSEIDLFFSYCPASIVGITGTNGKTTTTALTAELLRAGGLKVMRGGNIGEPVLDRVDQLSAEDWVVLELSSFQLESIANPRLKVAAVLNVTEDHLDRHRTFERYADIKARAVSFLEPTDHAVLNFDDPVCVGFSTRTRGNVVPFSTRPGRVAKGIGVDEGWICITPNPAQKNSTQKNSTQKNSTQIRLIPVAEIPLPGEHNLSNVLAAVGVASSVGIGTQPMAEAVRRFKGVEHRLELIGSFKGVRWYNDSKATNPDSTYKALEAFSEPMVLIAGGRNKGIDLAPLARAIASRVETLVAIGETGEELVSRVKAEGLSRAALASGIADAVHRAAAAARPGSVVLLSPGFASYDMFQDFEDRGRRFKSAVLAEVGS
jgi:UDP-N-acetylmuramoylalanine--D-glutamate ligase